MTLNLKFQINLNNKIIISNPQILLLMSKSNYLIKADLIESKKIIMGLILIILKIIISKLIYLLRISF